MGVLGKIEKVRLAVILDIDLYCRVSHETFEAVRLFDHEKRHIGETPRPVRSFSKEGYQRNSVISVALFSVDTSYLLRMSSYSINNFILQAEQMLK